MQESPRLPRCAASWGRSEKAPQARQPEACGSRGQCLSADYVTRASGALSMAAQFLAPLLVLGTGIIVGYAVLAMYMPLYALMRALLA